MSDRTAHPDLHVSHHIIFSGRVQGVGFRFSAQRFASERGLTGWVRNLPDGDVELHAEGGLSMVQDLVLTLKNHFSIETVKVCEGPASGAFTSFDIRY